MKRMMVMAATAGAMAMAMPALADVKTGVDAWQQGDYAKAVAEWRPLADSGDPDAQFNMGQAYKLGRGVPADLGQAIDWYRRASQQGHLRAEDNLGLLLFQQGDRTGALPYLQRAAQRGEPRAQYIVGTTLFNGDLIGKDWVRAYALMTRAAASGLEQASASLAQMDKYIPEDQRKQGLAMAASLNQGSGPALAAATARPTPAPSSVRTAQLPPSTIGAPVAAPRPAPMPEPKMAQAAAPRPVVPAPAVAKPVPRPAPVSAPAAGGGWRVQLGAFGEDGNARALWSKLTSRVSGLSAYQSYMVRAGNVTRLQAGPVASNAEAERLCGRIKAAGADCIPKKM